MWRAKQCSETSTPVNHTRVPPLQLRTIFPGADAFKLALREPFLVYGSTIFRLQRAATELRGLLPGLDVDRCAHTNFGLWAAGP